MLTSGSSDPWPLDPDAGPWPLNPDPALTAYEAIAAQYDEQIRGDEWMRRALHRHYLLAFSPGQRVLDLGCGTGTDALVLAQRGIAVVGIDGSPAMIAQLRSKAAAARLDRLTEGSVLPLAELGSLGERFDGAYSSFAALSTVDLARLGEDMARLVRPGGRVVLHLLNRFSLWEWLGLLGHRQWRAASKLHRQRVRGFRIGGVEVEHRQYFAREAYARFFAHGYVLRKRYALGALRPPHTVKRLPRGLTAALENLDTRLGGLPGVRDAGRFFVLDLERRA